MTTFVEGISAVVESVRRGTHIQKLPNRVLESIRRNDELSEVLVRCIQLVILALMGLIFFLSPQPNPDTISRVPIVLALYFVFTAVTLYLAAKQELPKWIIYLSIVVDAGLLTYLIWSFHIQYEQPPSFSMKSPSFVVFFVLIGLRALRFDYRYVLASGLACIMGWMVLVVYVTTIDPNDPMITRDYITYLTSNSVLIGAEIDKMIALALFTGTLALAVWRARRFYVESIMEAAAAKGLSRFMEPSVVESIRDAERDILPGEGIRREAAILNVDIRGFTTLTANSEPSRLMTLLADYQQRIVPIIHAHHGVVDKFLGDGIMATFGATHDDEKASANALRCIDAILETTQTWDGPSANLEINMAAAAGPVVFGAVGDADRLEYTVIGNAVNLSAKLEKHNKTIATKALCDSTLYDRAKRQGYQEKTVPRARTVNLADGPENVPVMVIA